MSSSVSPQSRRVDDVDLISSPVTLPNGAVVPNRLVKVGAALMSQSPAGSLAAPKAGTDAPQAAMEEGIGNGGGLPDKRHRRLYKRWAEGGWGMIVSGNVQVDPRHLATPHDRCFSDHMPNTTAAFALLRDAVLSSVPVDTPAPLLLMQISHAGLQSSSTMNLSRYPWERAIAPTSARPDTGTSALGWLLGRVLWPLKSRTVLDFDEWLSIAEKFVDGAATAQSAGWDGVQVHSAHGYLLAEYLSPLTNPDPRPLPGVPWKIPLRLHLLWLILSKISSVTNRSFVKAVKINCSDFVQGGLDESQSSVIITELVSWNLIDVLEISGGNYSSPEFATFDHITSSTRHSIFAHFTHELLPHLPPPPEGPAIILTGGLHSRPVIATAIRTRACDLAGVGRPACIKPDMPRKVFLNRDLQDEETNVGGYQIPGGETMKFLLGGGRTLKSRENGKQYPPLASYVNGEDIESTPLLNTEVSRKTSKGIPLVGAGISTYWHEWQLCRLGRGVEPDSRMHWFWGGCLREALWWGLLGGGPVGWWRSMRS